MSLPKSLSFPSVKSNAVASVSSVYTCSPVNSSTNYQPGQIIQFDIPAGIRSQWMDPSQTYLRFTVNVSFTSGTTAAAWQAMPYDFIQNASLYSSAGSKNIEMLQSYSNAHTVLRDLYSDVSNKTSDSILLNASSTNQRVGSSLTAGSVTYAIPLASIIGLQSAGSVMLPLHALNAPLRLELTLASAAQALTLTNAPTGIAYQITTPTLSVGLITISDLSQQQITQMTGGVYNFSSVIYRTFRQSQPAGQASNTILIPARFSSLRSIMVSQRNASAQENSAAYSVTDRIRNYLQSYQFRVGSSYASQKPIDCTGNAVDAWMALRATLGEHLTAESLPTLLSRSDWTNDGVAVAGGNPGSFLIAQSLEPFSNQSALLSGTNTSASQCFLELNYDPAQTANIQACVLDAVVAADCLVTIAGGEMNISF
jgi:hypothetical protein